MSKIMRVTQQPFGTSGPTGDFGAFGSKAVNPSSPIFTQNPTTIQSLPPFSEGWGQAIIGNYEPALEDMNGLFLLAFYQLGYLLQTGIPEYDTGTTYFLNSFIQYGGLLYQCTNDNSGVGITGIVPTNGAYWSSLQKTPAYVKCTNTQASGTPGGTSAGGSWNLLPLNTKDNDSNGIASLSGSQITLPSGTYTVTASSPFYCNGSGINAQIRVYNINNSTILVNGQNSFSANSLNVGVTALLEGQFTLLTASVIELQYQITTGTGYTSQGLGQAFSFGPEVYATIVLEQVLNVLT